MLSSVGWKKKTGSRLTIWPPDLKAARKIQKTGKKEDERDRAREEVIGVLPPGMGAHFSCARVSR